MRRRLFAMILAAAVAFAAILPTRALADVRIFFDEDGTPGDTGNTGDNGNTGDSGNNGETGNDGETTNFPIKLNAPTSVIIAMATEESPTAFRITYNKDDSIREWLTKSDEEKAAILKELGYESIKVFAQIDWALDDPKAWHYSQVWDSDTGHDKIDDDHPDEYVLGEWAYIDCPVTAEVVDAAVILKEIGDPTDENDEHWNNGKIGYFSKGWRTALKSSNYSLVDVEGKEGAKQVVIDVKEHTLYVRVRIGVAITEKIETTDAGTDTDNQTGDNKSDDNKTDDKKSDDKKTDDKKDDKKDDKADDKKDEAPAVKTTYQFSDWSKMSVFGARDNDVMFRLEELFPAPTISDIHYIGKDENGLGAIIEYTLNASEATAEAAKSVEADGGYAQIFVDARIAGSDEWIELGGDTAIEIGQNKVDLSNMDITADDIKNIETIEFRAVYFVYIPQSDEEVYTSEYSGVIRWSPESDPGTQVTPEPSPTGVIMPTHSPELLAQLEEPVVMPDEDKCNFCGICPVQPLGVCLLLWIGGVIAIIIVVVLIVRSSSKKNRRRKKARRH
ncbi:MAG: hypothetical protein IK055_05710 [Lachnospiraceae bacterium]|nr:hypothetical protein [Lachnospiraceae bacterium]